VQPSFKGRQVVEEKSEGLADRWGFYHVIVVEDEDQAIWEARYLIEQEGQNRFDVDRARGLKRGQCPLPNAIFNGLQSSDQVSQKAGQVVVPFIQ
jgi:hypothetical protein